MADQEEVDDDAERREEERVGALQLKREALAKIEAKLEKREKNLNPKDSRLSESDLRRLDGSVKKNSTFQRKLRSLTEQQRSSLTADLKTLNLSKYMEELASSIAEAKLKLADVNCAVHISTLLHHRYGTFSEMLLESLQRMYHLPIGKDEDKSAVISKYRLGLRLTGELVLTGVVEQDLGLSLLHEMLATVMKADRDGHPYLSVVVSFARHFAEDVADIWPRKQKLLLSKFDIEPPHSKLLPSSKQVEFRHLFQTYLSSVSQHLVRKHNDLHRREKRNHQLLISKGEISEERQAENETAQKAYDKLLTSMSTLAEVLDEDMPDLPEYQAPHEESDISIELQFPSLGESDEADPNALWEDEDTRQFYEGITDIKPFIPAILLEERKKSASGSTDEAMAVTDDNQTPPPSGDLADAEKEIDPADDEEKLIEQMILDSEENQEDEGEGEEEEEEEEEEGVATSEEPPEEVEDKTGGEQSSLASLFEQFTARLPNMLNRKLVDEMAVQFCMSLNTKIYRKKLARTLYSVEKNRMDLIPFYSRFVATLAPFLDDVVPALLEILLRDLRFQIRKKDQLHIHTKLKNIRLLAELTKFGICQKAEAMKCITLVLREFAHHHIDMTCLFLEHCGRFLLRSPDSHLRAKALLEILIRKKKVQHLDGRQRSLIENALYYANPPETPQFTAVEVPPMEQYIKKLLFKDLNKMNTEKILKQIRKMDWGDPSVVHLTVSSLSYIWNVKYNNIHCMANLLAGLKNYQEEAVIRVVDAVLEDIRLGLELNMSKLNQRRVSSIKFIGELYTYQLLESNVIFRILYLLLQFGSNPDGSSSPLDPFNSYFRVRLVCILLDTCGQYFDRGSSKRRLDAFLIYFQCYLFTKKQPQPLEVENLIRDTIESLRPQLEFYKTPQEAYEAALELETKYKDKIGSTGTGEESEEEEEEEEQQRDVGRGGKEDEEEEEDEEDEGGETEEEEGNIMEDTFEKDPILKAATLVKCPEDDSFMAELEKMMNEDIQTRKVENLKVPNMDVAVPMQLKGPTSADKTALIHDEGELKMKFKLMTRKGHKQQLKELTIPLDSDLTSGLRDTRQANNEAYEEMKQKVLDYERRQEEEDYQAMVAAELESQLKSGSKRAQSHKNQQQYQQQPYSSSATANTPSSQQQRHSGEGGGQSQSQPQFRGYQGQNRGGSSDTRSQGWRGGGGGGGGGRGGGRGGRGGRGGGGRGGRGGGGGDSGNNYRHRQDH